MRLDEIAATHRGAGPIPEKIHGENDGRRKSRLAVAGQRSCQNYHIAAVVRALHPPFVPVPCHAEIGVAALPRVRPWRHLFGAWDQPPDQRILQKRVAAFGRVVLQSCVDREALGQKHLRDHAVHIPGIPALGQALLHLAVLSGFRRWQRLARSDSRTDGRSLRLRTAGQPHASYQDCQSVARYTAQPRHSIQAPLRVHSDS